MVNYGDYSKIINPWMSGNRSPYSANNSNFDDIFDFSTKNGCGDTYSGSGGWDSTEFNPYLERLGLPKYIWSAFSGTDDALVKSQETLIDLIRYYEGDPKKNYKAKAKYDDRGNIETRGYGITNLNSEPLP